MAAEDCHTGCLEGMMNPNKAVARNVLAHAIQAKHENKVEKLTAALEACKNNYMDPDEYAVWEKATATAKLEHMVEEAGRQDAEAAVEEAELKVKMEEALDVQRSQTRSWFHLFNSAGDPEFEAQKKVAEVKGPLLAVQQKRRALQQEKNAKQKELEAVST